MSIQITLGETEYTLPDRMNIGQLEKVADAVAAGGSAFKILEIGMTRSEPEVQQIRDLPASLDQIAFAVNAIMIAGGFKKAAPEAPVVGD